MKRTMPGLPVRHQLPEPTQTHVHWVSDAIHPTISSSVVPFSSLQSFPASGSFPMNLLFTSGGWSIGAPSSPSVPPTNIQGWFPLELIGLISLQPKGFSRVFSSTTVWKHYCDAEWFPLEMNRDHSVIFEIAPNTAGAFWTLLMYYEGYSISSKRFLTTVEGLMIIWIKFTHSFPF